MQHSDAQYGVPTGMRTSKVPMRCCSSSLPLVCMARVVTMQAFHTERHSQVFKANTNSAQSQCTNCNMVQPCW